MPSAQQLFKGYLTAAEAGLTPAEGTGPHLCKVPSAWATTCFQHDLDAIIRLHA